VNPDLRNLIHLQDIDQKIAAFKKQISEIPGQIQSLQQQKQQLVQSYEQRSARLQELGKQRRAQEGEVELMRTKLARLKDQLMSVKTNKEYTVMLHEIQGAEEIIRRSEDGILEIMEQAEAMEAGLTEAERELKARGAELDAQIRATEQRLPTLEAEVVRVTGEKTALEGMIGTAMLERYHRIADARRGVAIAEAKDELCASCHVRIRPQVYAELMRTDEIHVCDSCSRILFLREAL